MSAAMQELLDILNLEQLEHNLFRGRSPAIAWQRVFGGQTIAQSLVAAQRTVEPDRHVHSLHGYFMRPGDITVPIVYEVDRIRDGKSFTTRRVVAIQHGEAIFSLEASFQLEEKGLEHQVAMPLDVPPPEMLQSHLELMQHAAHLPEAVRKFWSRERPLDIRPVNVEHYSSRDKLPPQQYVWMRLKGAVPDDRSIQSVLLAYLSDMTLLDTATFAHGLAIFAPEVQGASIDHAMWFHRPDALNDWLLYVQDSPSSSGARGFCRGAIYSRDGRLVASVAQEGLIRVRSSA